MAAADSTVALPVLEGAHPYELTTAPTGLLSRPSDPDSNFEQCESGLVLTSGESGASTVYALAASLPRGVHAR